MSIHPPVGEILDPATATPPAELSVSGFVCVKPDGQPFWHSARATVEDSLFACFGGEEPGSRRLERLAEEGWRCIPIGGGPAAPFRSALVEADKQAESGLCCFGKEGMHSALKAIRRAISAVGVQGGLTEA